MCDKGAKTQGAYDGVEYVKGAQVNGAQVELERTSKERTSKGRTGYLCKYPPQICKYDMCVSSVITIEVQLVRFERIIAIIIRSRTKSYQT